MGARGKNIVHFHLAYIYMRDISFFHLRSERIENFACFGHFPYFKCFAYFAYLHFAGWHKVRERNYDIFVAKTLNYDIFVAKIYDYALIDSF